MIIQITKMLQYNYQFYLQEAKQHEKHTKKDRCHF